MGYQDLPVLSVLPVAFTVDSLVTGRVRIGSASNDATAGGFWVGTNADSPTKANAAFWASGNFTFFQAVTRISFTVGAGGFDLFSDRVSLYAGMKIQADSGNALSMGYASLTSMTNADYTLAAGEMNQRTLLVPASLTLSANRVLIAPLTAGAQYDVINNSTGGFSVSVKGSSGTASPLIGPGLMRHVTTDGVNYY
jgi:hypothetical protein